MNENKIALIGFENAAVTIEFKFYIQQKSNTQVVVINPYDFLSHDSSKEFLYMVSITRDLKLRKQVVDHLEKNHYKKFTFIHDTANIVDTAKIGPGSFVSPFAVILSNTIIEDDCIIAPQCLVSHGVTIGQGTVMNSMSMVAGSTKIGKYCKLNMKSSVIDFLEIGNFIEIGAGSMLTKSVTVEGTYVGVPARKIDGTKFADDSTVAV